MAAEIHGDPAGLVGHGRGGRLEAAGVADADKKFFGMQTVEIGDEAVVGEDL